MNHFAFGCNQNPKFNPFNQVASVGPSQVGKPVGWNENNLQESVEKLFFF